MADALQYFHRFLGLVQGRTVLTGPIQLYRLTNQWNDSTDLGLARNGNLQPFIESF